MTYAHNYHRLVQLEKRHAQVQSPTEKRLLQVQINVLTEEVAKQLDATTGIPGSFFTMRNLQAIHNELVFA